MDQSEKATLSVVMPADLKQWIKIEAVKQQTTASEIIRRSIEALRDGETGELAEMK